MVGVPDPGSECPPGGGDERCDRGDGEAAESERATVRAAESDEAFGDEVGGGEGHPSESAVGGLPP